MKAALTSGPLPAPSSPPDAVMQNSAAATAATMCNDVEWPDSVPLHQRSVSRCEELRQPWGCISKGYELLLREIDLLVAFKCAFFPCTKF